MTGEDNRFSATPAPHASGIRADESSGPTAPNVGGNIGSQTALAFVAGLALGLLVAVMCAMALMDALAAKTYQVKHLSEQLDELQEQRAK